MNESCEAVERASKLVPEQVILHEIARYPQMARGVVLLAEHCIGQARDKTFLASCVELGEVEADDAEEQAKMLAYLREVPNLSGLCSYEALERFFAEFDPALDPTCDLEFYECVLRALGPLAKETFAREALSVGDRE